MTTRQQRSRAFQSARRSSRPLAMIEALKAQIAARPDEPALTPEQAAEIVEVPVRVLNETDTGWCITTAPVGRRGGFWVDRAHVEIPDYHEIKPMLTARMTRAYAAKKGLLPRDT